METPLSHNMTSGVRISHGLLLKERTCSLAYLLPIAPNMSAKHKCFTVYYRINAELLVCVLAVLCLLIGMGLFLTEQWVGLRFWHFLVIVTCFLRQKIKYYRSRATTTCDFQQCGILTSEDSHEPLQPPF